MKTAILQIAAVADDTGNWVQLTSDGHEIDRYGPYPTTEEAIQRAEQAADIAKNFARTLGDRARILPT